MRDCPRTLPALGVLIAAAVAVTLPAPARAARLHHWEVTLAVRVSGGTGNPVSVRVALPADSPTQQLSEVEVVARGLKDSVVRDQGDPYLLLTGKLKGSRRIRISYRIATRRQLDAVPPVLPVDPPLPALLPYMQPTPLLQSRSILVREFLETHVGPFITSVDADIMRPIYDTTRKQIARRHEGKSLVLDVIRSRQGQRLGIERAFTTFLRCARIPARFVEGIDLKLTTPRKRVYWTEVWAHNAWWPVSASGGWLGRRPASHIALARDGARVVSVDADAKVSYRIETHELGSEALPTEAPK